MTALKKYTAPEFDYGICRFSGRPRRPTYDQAKLEQQTRLEALKGSDGVVSFCTNIMMSRGTIYDCRIDSAGNAIAFRTRTWWAMSFSENKKIDKNLGAVIASQVSGSLTFRLAVGHLKEGRG
jgi:hypothetical protein